MKGWAKKEDCIAAAKALRIKAWLGGFNQWVPCTVQQPALEDGRYEAKFKPPSPSVSIKLTLPKASIMVDHSFFKHSVSMRLYEAFKQENDERKATVVLKIADEDV